MLDPDPLVAFGRPGGWVAVGGDHRADLGEPLLEDLGSPLAFHRVLTGTGLDAEALEDAWRRVGLTVHAGPADAVASPGRVVVRCPNRTLLVELPPATELRIDHAVVEDLLLHKALGIDPAGTNVRPLPAGRPHPAAADAVLLLAPVPLADVRAVHAHGQRMPRKSTYFTPKPRSGLVLADLLLSTDDRPNEVHPR